MSNSSNASAGDPQPRRLFAVAVLVRLAYYFLFLQSPYAVVQLTDQAYYRNWGTAIAGGEFLGTEAFEQGPLYAYLLGFLYSLGLTDNVIIFLQLLAGATLAPLVYACARKLVDQPRVAIVAGLLTACYGPLIYHEAMVMKSWLSPLLTTLSLWMTLQFYTTSRLRWLFGAGGSIGLACLLRENHILLLFPLLASIWLERKTLVTNPLWKCIAIPILGCMLMISPATIRNYVVSGEFVLVTSGGGEVLYMAQGPYARANYNPPPFIRPNPYYEHEDFRKEAGRRTGKRMSRAGSSQYWSQEAFAYVKSEPVHALALTGAKAFNLVNNFEVPDNQDFQVTQSFIFLLYLLPRFGWLLGFALLGLWLSCTQFKKHLLPCGMIAAHAFTIVLIYNFDRFRIGLVPILTIYTGVGFVYLYRQLRNQLQDGEWKHVPKFITKTKIIPVSIVLIGTVVSFCPPRQISDEYWTDAEQKKVTLLQMTQVYDKSEELRLLVEQRPEDAELWAQYGRMLYTLGLFEDAKTAYDRALKIAPHRADIVCYKADALKGLRKNELAADLLSVLIEKQPDHLPAYVSLAGIKADLYDLPAAVQLMEQAIKVDNKNPILWMNLGSYAAQRCFSKGKAEGKQDVQSCEKARNAFTTALNVNPANAQARYQYIDYLQQAGSWQETLVELDVALKMQQDHTVYQGLMLELLRKYGSEFNDESVREFHRLYERLVQAEVIKGNKKSAANLIVKCQAIAEKQKQPTLTELLKKTASRYPVQ